MELLLLGCSIPGGGSDRVGIVGLVGVSLSLGTLSTTLPGYLACSWCILNLSVFPSFYFLVTYFSSRLSSSLLSLSIQDLRYYQLV